MLSRFSITAALLAAFLGATSGEVSAELISHWEFSGNLEAGVGERDGTDVNGVTFDADPFGNPGSALAVDGSAQQYVEVPEGGGLDDLQEGTIALFVKWVGEQDAACCNSVGNILARQSNGQFSNQVIGLDSPDPTTAFITWQPYSAGGPAIIGETAVGDGDWHHIAITWTDGEHLLYRDGEVDGSSDASGAMRSDLNVPLTIGAWSGDGGGYSTSMIDEVKVFNHVLTQNEIRELMLPPSAISLSAKEFLTIASQGDPIGTLHTVAGDPEDTFVYALTAGDGDEHNAKFQIGGDVLQVGAFNFSAEEDAATFSVRVRATGSPSGETFEATFTLTVRADSDADQLLDAYELRFSEDLGTLSGLGDADADGDGLTDLKEFGLSQGAYPDIDPTKSDTDGDTLNDGAEIAGAGTRPPTHPTNVDTDGDALSDASETNSGIIVSAVDTGSNPVLSDTDGDGFKDGRELELGSDPNDAGSLPPAALIAHWPFDGGLEDVVGGNDGVAINDAGFGDDRSGEGGGALSVDGLSEQYVEVEGGGGLNALQEGTIAFFAKWSGEQDTACCGGTFGNVLSRQSNGQFSNQVVGLDSSDPGAALITWQPYNAGGPALAGATPVGDDVWHHIAITWQSGHHVLYLDGEVDGASETTGTMNNNEGVPLAIGAWIGDGAGYSTSSLDDLMVFDGILSQDQVRALATGGKASDFRITHIVRDGATRAVTITWNSRAGQAYGVEFSTGLGTWIELDDGVEATGNSTSYTDQTVAPNASGAGFYRVTRL